MNQENEDNISYYMPPKSIFKRIALRLARIMGLLLYPIQRHARWKKHNVYKFRQRKGFDVKMSSGRTWKRHRIPPMPRSRYIYM